MKRISLRPADRVEISVIVDNYTDLLLLQNKGIMRRPKMPRRKTPFAEHGLSVLIKVYEGSETYTILMDASTTPICLLNNLEVFGIDVHNIDCVILSHGHHDHFGGLMGLLDKAPTIKQLILHPDAFQPRRLIIPDDKHPFEMPILDEARINETGIEIIQKNNASTWFSDLMLTTGEVERTTDFEKGFPWAEIQIDGTWCNDSFLDDQGVVLKIKNRGLIVIGGCSHAGIINTIKYAMKLTNTEKVHAVLGGFHLSGSVFEKTIEATVREMKKLKPDYIIPLHCTGWLAIKEFSQMMPDQFFLNTIGTSYLFE